MGRSKMRVKTGLSCTASWKSLRNCVMASNTLVMRFDKASARSVSVSSFAKTKSACTSESLGVRSEICANGVSDISWNFSGVTVNTAGRTLAKEDWGCPSICSRASARPA